MITPAAIIAVASSAALVILGLALILTVWRVVAGPTLPDRILALDMLTGIAIGFIAVIAVKTRFSLYIDIAISLGLVGFLATVAFARFVLSRGNIKSKPSASAANGKTQKRRAGGKKR
ncbi:cation:proton antiporter [Rhizobium brockwellii]|uniref:Cation:proton antiporter n=1 Tax=Rhizobium brockwellii TaxID=3019932 RepID=A0ABU3YJM5_9HYPH|nr:MULTISPECIES: cation:proton antiporter [Rhizobium]KPN28400.1 cation:proton antiporter [Rhizobium brockwellii]MDV4154263.1 cation:proton antiporter [Rhizobium brockwellii]MDV4178981.1 cation:proton antiporter [Rhizobium brockwellii]MDV4185979.1 cation:proton antiporter [Rhizobium brockwellii]QJX04354.1 cation:proton antiporter [Rhizobium brockwellii]